MEKGFTIIELIVVIAIIAVLAGIVLVSVSVYTTKSKDAALKASLGSFPNMVASYLETHSGTTNNVCNPNAGFNTDFQRIVDQTNSLGVAGSLVCKDTFGAYASNGYYSGGMITCGVPGQWLIVATIPSDNSQYWCIDSTGTKKILSGVPGEDTCTCYVGGIID